MSGETAAPQAAASPRTTDSCLTSISVDGATDLGNHTIFSAEAAPAWPADQQVPPGTLAALDTLAAPGAEYLPRSERERLWHIAKASARPHGRVIPGSPTSKTMRQAQELLRARQKKELGLPRRSSDSQPCAVNLPVLAASNRLLAGADVTVWDGKKGPAGLKALLLRVARAGHDQNAPPILRQTARVWARVLERVIQPVRNISSRLCVLRARSRYRRRRRTRRQSRAGPDSDDAGGESEPPERTAAAPDGVAA